MEEKKQSHAARGVLESCMKNSSKTYAVPRMVETPAGRSAAWFRLSCLSRSATGDRGSVGRRFSAVSILDVFDVC